MKKPMQVTMQLPKFDSLYTPLRAVAPLLRHVNLKPDSLIWECCDPGISNISEALRSCGFDVVSTDIETGFDFLEDKPDFSFDAIITNPPYSLKDEFLERCYAYGKPFALLLPITSLEGIRRSRLFRTHGVSVIVLDKRMDFTGKKSNWFNVSWFCWGFLPANILAFENLK